MIIWCLPYNPEAAYKLGQEDRTYEHASGNTICEVCNREYYEHLSLNLLCNGRLVKL